VLWELATRQRPYEESSDAMIREGVKSGQRLPIPKDIPDPFRELIELCWQGNPQERPNFSKIMEFIAANAAEVIAAPMPRSEGGASYTRGGLSSSSSNSSGLSSASSNHSDSLSI